MDNDGWLWMILDYGRLLIMEYSGWLRCVSTWIQTSFQIRTKHINQQGLGNSLPSKKISQAGLDLLTYQPRSIAWAGWTRLPKTSQLPTPDYCSWPQPWSARQSVGKASLPHWKFWDTCALPKFKHAMRVRTTPLDPQVTCHLPALGFRRVLEFLDRKIDNSPTLLLVNGLNGSKCHNQREVFLPGHCHPRIVPGWHVCSWLLKELWSCRGMVTL